MIKAQKERMRAYIKIVIAAFLFFSLIRIFSIINSSAEYALLYNGTTFHLEKEIGDYKLYSIRTNACHKMREVVHIDEYYTYYFPCVMSGRYIIVIDDEVFTISESMISGAIDHYVLTKLIPEIRIRASNH